MEDLRHLLPFVEIVKSGSFAGAAARLGVTPPAISKSIKRLESRLGVRLINRTTRRLHLTGEGQQFFTQLETLLSGIGDAVRNVRETADQPAGKIRISVGATFGRYSLLPVLIEFMKIHPKVDLVISFDDTPSGLIEQGFDLGIHHGLGSETSFVVRELCDYPLILVASPEYLAQRGIPRTPEELKGHDCIGTVTGANAPSDWQLEPVQRRGRKQIRSDARLYTHVLHPRLSIARQWDSNLSAVLLGAGIAPTSLPASLQFLKQGRMKVVLPDYRLWPGAGGMGKIFMLYPHREHQPTKLRVLTKFLSDWFRTHRIEVSDLREYAA